MIQWRIALQVNVFLFNLVHEGNIIVINIAPSHTQIFQLQQIKNVANQVSSKLPPTTNRSTSAMYRPRCASLFALHYFLDCTFKYDSLRRFMIQGSDVRGQSCIQNILSLENALFGIDEVCLKRREREKKNLVKPNRMLTRPS